MSTIITNNYNRETKQYETLQNARIVVGSQIDGSVYLLLMERGGRIFANLGMTAHEAHAFANQLLVAAVQAEYTADFDTRKAH